MLSTHTRDDGRKITLWWEDGIARILGSHLAQDRPVFTAWLNRLYSEVLRSTDPDEWAHTVGATTWAMGVALFDTYNRETGESRATLPMLTKLAHIHARSYVLGKDKYDPGPEPYTVAEYTFALEWLEVLGAIAIRRMKEGGYRPGLGKMNRYRIILDAVQQPAANEGETQQQP